MIHDGLVYLCRENGNLLVVERRFSLLGGLGIRLARVARETLVPGAIDAQAKRQLIAAERANAS